MSDQRKAGQSLNDHMEGTNKLWCEIWGRAKKELFVERLEVLITRLKPQEASAPICPLPEDARIQIDEIFKEWEQRQREFFRQCHGRNILLEYLAWYISAFDLRTHWWRWRVKEDLAHEPVKIPKAFPLAAEVYRELSASQPSAVTPTDSSDPVPPLASPMPGA